MNERETALVKIDDSGSIDAPSGFAKNLKRFVKASTLSTAAALAIACGSDRQEGGVTVAPLDKTSTVEVIETPTVLFTTTPEPTKTPTPEDRNLTLSEISRANYLDVFSTDEYYLLEKDVFRQPTDSEDNFVRVYQKDVEGTERRGVTFEKIDRNSGNVIGEIKSMRSFVDEIGRIDSKEEALALIFASDQNIISYWDTQLTDSTIFAESVAAIRIDGDECQLARYDVIRQFGEIIRVASEVGQVGEGECEN